MLPAAPERVQSVAGKAPNSLNVLGMFSLNTLAPGPYTLRVNVEDTLRHTKSTSQMDFAVVAAK